MTRNIKTTSLKLLADTLTPVNIYLKLRDVFANSILLESSDYHGHENSLSIICCDPIASFQASGRAIDASVPGEPRRRFEATENAEVLTHFKNFVHGFKPEKISPLPGCGLFGYMAYDAVQYAENIPIRKADNTLPDIAYSLYRYVIVVDHFRNELTLMVNSVEGDDDQAADPERIRQLIFSNRFSTYRFQSAEAEASNLTDDEYMDRVRKGMEHCRRGDVFQIVLSRRFTSGFKGDEFNVYRALRSINPSPYLFYFDYGNYKLFGSSPEAQLQVRNGRAHIFPIAGTFRRTGNDQEDALLAEKLARDEKENAEHIMLVDLARNDMSRHAAHVSVEVFKEIQFYSHVIHLVSKVTGELSHDISVVDLAFDTFPAGTLSGAPKHKAMTLISELENVNRGFYGGAIGYIGFEGVFNHAIMIRTFLSRNNQLVCQAGAGIVSKSVPEKELEEVNNKLGALRKAIALAETL
jgi:anthranilate synthase component 1